MKNLAWNVCPVFYREGIVTSFVVAVACGLVVRGSSLLLEDTGESPTSVGCGVLSNPIAPQALHRAVTGPHQWTDALGTFQCSLGRTFLSYLLGSVSLLLILCHFTDRVFLATFLMMVKKGSYLKRFFFFCLREILIWMSFITLKTVSLFFYLFVIDFSAWTNKHINMKTKKRTPT